MRKIVRFISGLMLCIFIVTTVGIIDFFAILYIPFNNLRDLWVTTAMTTMTHRWLATAFLPENIIKEIQDKNKMLVQGGKVNLNKIKVNNSKLNIEETPVKGKTFQGYMLSISDPSHVYLKVADNYGAVGEKLYDMAKSVDALAGMNAGGFDDDNGQGTGGGTDGIIISQGRLIQKPKDKTVDLIGFTKDNKLVVGDYSYREIEDMNLRDAVSFHPTLIVNGIPNKIVGNGGGGLQPRTIIGQKSDGTVLMLVIDGRQTKSLGAYLKDAQNIMIEYEAVNAACLDGGSSATMYYNGRIINSPCSKDGARYLPDAFIVKR